ncbi:MAG TPA: zf-HC2 domain-containing protein [Thermoanaerobaculia bacterium]|nr:zf-HC2 domain-containing protein [Thermoanaerobaculia bacterium]
MSWPCTLWSSLRNRFLRLCGRDEGPEPDGHPTPAQLAAYHEDRLPPEEDEEIQEHFVECPECPDLMLDLDRFASKKMPMLVVDDLTDRSVDRAWRRLRRQLLREIVVPGIPRPRLLWLKRPTLAWGMVGVLLPCTFSLGVRVETLASKLRILEAPQLNPPVARVPVPTVSRSRSVVTLRAELEVPPGAPRFLLMLEPPATAELPEYRLEIRTPRGESVWAAGGLTLNEEGRFVVGLSPGFLPAGEYNIFVLGVIQGHERLVQDYRVRFSYP